MSQLSLFRFLFLIFSIFVITNNNNPLLPYLLSGLGNSEPLKHGFFDFIQMQLSAIDDDAISSAFINVSTTPPLTSTKNGDLSRNEVLEESADSILQTLANDAAVAVKPGILDVPASDLSATVEQASEPGPSPFQVPGTMPEAPVIPAPANTMDNDDDANLASVADPLHD